MRVVSETTLHRYHPCFLQFILNFSNYTFSTACKFGTYLTYGMQNKSSTTRMNLPRMSPLHLTRVFLTIFKKVEYCVKRTLNNVELLNKLRYAYDTKRRLRRISKTTEFNNTIMYQ